MKRSEGSQRNSNKNWAPGDTYRAGIWWEDPVRETSWKKWYTEIEEKVRSDAEAGSCGGERMSSQDKFRTGQGPAPKEPGSKRWKGVAEHGVLGRVARKHSWGFHDCGGLLIKHERQNYKDL